jgi:uncharacterized membrane protein
MDDNQEIISEVKRLSPSGPIAVQNSLYPHLSQRENIYLLPEIGNAPYIVVDLRDGPNKFAPMLYPQMKDFVHNLLTTKKYSIIYQRGDAILLAKIEQ